MIKNQNEKSNSYAYSLAQVRQKIKNQLQAHHHLHAAHQGGEKSEEGARENGKRGGIGARTVGKRDGGGEEGETDSVRDIL
jgi:hypothetical protein